MRDATASVLVRSLTIISSDLPEPERLQVAHAFKDCTCPLLEISSRVKVKLKDLGYAQATAEIPNLAVLLDTPLQDQPISPFWLLPVQSIGSTQS
jgi:hypothetical protein